MLVQIYMEKQPARNTDIDSTAQGSILLPTHWSILSSFVKFSLIDFHTFGNWHVCQTGETQPGGNSDSSSTSSVANHFSTPNKEKHK